MPSRDWLLNRNFIIIAPRRAEASVFHVLNQSRKALREVSASPKKMRAFITLATVALALGAGKVYGRVINDTKYLFAL